MRAAIQNGLSDIDVRDISVPGQDGALVRVTTPLLPGEARSTDDAASFIRALYLPLTQHLPE